MLFDINALRTIDRLRSHFGPLTINDWMWGGDFQESGFREWDTETGATLSQHKFGRAFDCKFKNVTAEEVREDMRKHNMFQAPQAIMKARPSRYAHIRRIESFKRMSWFHFDTAPVSLENGITIVRG